MYSGDKNIYPPPRMIAWIERGNLQNVLRKAPGIVSAQRTVIITIILNLSWPLLLHLSSTGNSIYAIGNFPYMDFLPQISLTVCISLFLSSGMNFFFFKSHSNIYYYSLRLWTPWQWDPKIILLWFTWPHKIKRIFNICWTNLKITKENLMQINLRMQNT